MLPAWQRLEQHVARYTLMPGARDPAVEMMRFPGLVGAYRACCLVEDRAPTQQAYAEWVLRLVNETVRGVARLPDAAAVRGRAGRAYPSLVAQHHAYLVARDAFGAAAWDDDLDMRYGVDLVVVGSGAVAVGLALMAPTERSREQAARKAVRYRGLPFTVVTLEVEPRAYMAGPFWLYRPDTIRDAVTVALRTRLSSLAEDLEAAAMDAYSSGLRRPKASRRDFTDGVNAALRPLRSEP